MKQRSIPRMLRSLAVMTFVIGLSIISYQTVNAAASLSLVSGSLQPDTVFQEFPFTLSFVINADSLTDPIDSAFATIAVLKSSDSSLVGVLFNGPVSESLLNGKRITYSNLVPQAINWGGTGVGLFAAQLSYQVYAGDSVAQFQTIIPSAITRMPVISVAYQAGTLTPVTIEPGTTHSFAFDVLSQDPYAFIVDEALSRLYFTGSSFSDTTGLSFAYDSLLPAIQTFTSGNMTVPANLSSDTFTISATLALIPKSLFGSGASPYLYHLSFGANKVVVQTMPQPTVQIVSLTVEAPNAPKVNTNQPFVVHARVANRSDADVGPVSFTLSTDGSATFNASAVIQFIPAHGEANLAIDVVADAQPNPGEVLRLSLTSTDVDELPALDDVAFAIVESPANLKLSYNLFGAQSGVVGYGQTFSLSIALDNLGQSEVTEATYLLTTDGVSFGIPDTIGGSLIVDQDITLNFRAPAYDTQAVFVIQILTVPVELNTNAPAALNVDSVTFTISVRQPGGDLFMKADPLANNVLTTDELTDIFSLLTTNRITLSTARIRLLNMTVDFAPIGTGTIDPAEFIDWSVSGIYRDNDLVSVATPSGNRVILSLNDVILTPQETTMLVIRLKLKDNAPHQFTFQQTLSDIQAIIIEGNTSRQAQVITSTPTTFLFSESYIVVGTSLSQSFIINNNPFDPAAGNALFNYQLTNAAPLTFRIYTVTGELVLEEEFSEGESHTSVGSHVISWDGKNGNGNAVLNGIYIAVLTNVRTSESARIKVAVVR